MTPEEVKSKLSEIRQEQTTLFDAVSRYNELERDKAKIRNTCPHLNAYLHNTETDNYEGRTYGQIICHDCVKSWEERIYMGKCKYPKWEGGLDWWK